MNKKLFMISVVMAFAMVFTACNKDDDPEDPVDNSPELNFIGGEGYISSDVTLAVGAEFKVGIVASENADTKRNISSFVVIRTFNNVPTMVYEEDGIGDPNYTWETTETATVVIGEERWTFTVTDNAGESKEIAFVITTEAGGEVVASYEGMNMGSFDDSDYGSFLNATAGAVLKKNAATAAQADIDIVFFYGATNGISFGAPSNAAVIDVYDLGSWSVKNETQFQAATITSSDFDNIGSTHTFPEFTGSASILNQLSVGDIIYFKTVTEQKGYIRINSTTKDGFEINIDLKIAE